MIGGVASCAGAGFTRWRGRVGGDDITPVLLPRNGEVDMRMARAARAAGAMAAQLSQAAGSLAISVVSLRSLRLADFAALSVLLSAVVFVTGLTTGLVGDTLTVLERRDAAIRTALRRVLLALAAGSLLVGAGWTWVTGFVPGPAAAAFGLLLALWVTEDVVRRLLMADLRFWSVVAIDAVHLAVSTGTALAWPLVSGTRPGITLYLIALCLGQVCAGVLGTALLPSAERAWGAPTGGGLRPVLAYGTARSLQAALRPGLLLVMRVVVIALAGALVYGHLEAARLYSAPALLVVNGIGAFLLSTFAAQRGAGGRTAVRRADLACAFLVGMTLALTALAMVLCLDWPRLLGGEVEVSPLAVAGWGVFTGAVAVSQPYGVLLAVTGAQRLVLAIRLLDSCVSLGVLAALLGTGLIRPDLAPLALAVGPAVSALLLRPIALRRLPMDRDPDEAPRAAVAL